MSNFKSMTNSFEIKICGINDKSSMVEAVNSEADYIGFVFYNNSPRNLTLSVAKSLVAFRNKRSKIVALTVNAKDEFISEIKEIYRLTTFSCMEMKPLKGVKKLN